MLTTALAVIAYLLNPFIPLAMAVLLLLFWSGVRATSAFAALHAAHPTVAALIPAGSNQGAVFGVDAATLQLSVQVHLFAIVATLISLVVYTEVNEFLRLNADLSTIADTAQRQAQEVKTVTETIPDALHSIDRLDHATPLNTRARAFVVPIHSIS